MITNTSDEPTFPITIWLTAAQYQALEEAVTFYGTSYEWLVCECFVKYGLPELNRQLQYELYTTHDDEDLPPFEGDDITHG